mmetsp:Transcript_55002/g.108636  ORF Transcript_55002/g.108636 Transcript_55002/m.108636 type:complete len:98 (+) Transcript_55002:105-398(+)
MENINDSPKLAARTCRICTKQFTENGDKACRYHPESYSGETAQRWLPPGSKGGDAVHNFYTCCGGDLESPGCCWTRHRTFDEPEDVGMRQPGMGVEP